MEKPVKGMGRPVPSFKPVKRNKFGGGETVKEKPMKMKKNKPAPMLGVYRKVK